jgi:hypothetical protein
VKIRLKERNEKIQIAKLILKVFFDTCSFGVEEKKR